MEGENTQGQGQPRQTARTTMPRRTKVLEHFTDAGDNKWQCKHCHLVFGANSKDGTSNLWKHLKKKCKGWDKGRESRPTSSSLPQPPTLPQLLPSSGRGESLDREPAGLEEDEASRDLARMIALHGYDPSFVEDDYFRSFVRRLNPGFKVPSRRAIEEMCDGIFDEARRDSFSRARSAPGRVSFAVRKAKTIEAGEAMYVACHFIDDQWKLHKVVADAFVPEGQHQSEDGPILGVYYVLSDATDVAVNLISKHKDRLSMVAYDFANGDIHRILKNYFAGVNSDRNLSCTTTTYVDTLLHSIARCLVPDSDFSMNMYQHMMDLGLTRQERLQLLSELGLDYEWAYEERWCACYYSLEVLRIKDFTKFLGADLFVELLCKVWGQVYHVIQRISASTFNTSNLCLAELLKLREILQSELARVGNEDEYHFDGLAVNVLRKACGSLDEAIQESFLVWSIPLALDPRYKLRYIDFSFKRAFGSEAGKYISEVSAKIYKLYADYIKEYGATNATDHSDNAIAMMATTSTDSWDQAWYDERRSQDIMAAQVNSSYTETQTDLDRYLQDPLASEIKETDFDILNWWKENSQKYPMVARMARDALAMPTCSKPSSDQLAQVRSILRGYSKKSFRDYAMSWWLVP